MLASDTEEYKTATQEERDNNWIFAGAKIPIPFELGVMFKVFPERILENFFGTDTGEDLKKSIFRNLTSTLVMNPIPHAFVPIVEHIADYSFFTGQEVVGRGMEGLATRYQAQPGTSLLAKTVGKETGASPVVLDNYIRGYTGTIGTYIVMAIDAIMHGEGDDIKASKRLEQMPVFRRFMSNKLGSGTVNAYYDLKKEVETSTRTINYLERQGRMDDMAEFVTYNRAWFYLSKIDLKLKYHVDSIKTFTDGDLLFCLKLAIKYFENREEYEKCAHIKKIQDKVEKFLNKA
jgi:hypothetical protein